MTRILANRGRKESCCARSWLALALLMLGHAACTSPKRTIRIPDSVVPNPKNKETGAKSSMQPYVIKMSDGKRTYQIEIPAGHQAGAFSTAIPLDLSKLDIEAPEIPATEADREIIEAKRSSGEPHPKTTEGENPRARSYLRTLARVNELFRKRQYELALIDLTALDREYPDDERVLEMKGTIYWKLRRPKQAREAWERVLQLNPSNTIVAEALEQLVQDGE